MFPNLVQHWVVAGKFDSIVFKRLKKEDHSRLFFNKICINLMYFMIVYYVNIQFTQFYRQISFAVIYTFLGNKISLINLVV